MDKKAPNCPTCKHFYLTWEMPYSRGCRKLGFKSRGMPSWEVLRVGGTSCPVYEAKRHLAQKRSGTKNG